MLPLSTDLVFAPTLAHWNSACALPSRPSQPDVAILRRCGLPLGYAMNRSRGDRAAYVGPFDRICRGLRLKNPQLQTRKKRHSVYQIMKTPESRAAQSARNAPDAAERAPGEHAARTPDTMRGRCSFEAPRVERPARSCEACMLSRRRQACGAHARSARETRGKRVETTLDRRGIRARTAGAGHESAVCGAWKAPCYPRRMTIARHNPRPRPARPTAREAAHARAFPAASVC